MANRTRFLAGAPNSVDADLINEFNASGGRLNLAEKVNIRMAFAACKLGASDDAASRAAVKSSPETADISDRDKSLLMDHFTNKHGFMVTTRRLLCTELVNKIFHQYHARPRAMKMYLPLQLRLSTSAAIAIGTSRTFSTN